MPPIKRPGRLLAATAALALLATAPAALAASGTLNGSIRPNKGPIGSPLTLTTGFTIDPDPGRDPGTLSRVELFFPAVARANGARFPVCTAAMINAVRGRFTNCPRGSQIGTGFARVDVAALELQNVPARITLFNGRGGKSITVHTFATNPVLISEAFDAPLVKTTGRYGYHLTASLPYSLQEISDGWFQGVRTFTSTVGATYRGIPYIETTRECPRSLSVPIAGKLGFLRENAPIDFSTTIRCRR